MDVRDEDTNSELSTKTSITSRYNSVNSRNYYKRPNSTIVFKEENVNSYTDVNGTVYRVSDHVYMDTNKPNQPFAIGCALDFKITKKDTYMIELRWYYRPNEIPDGVYALLMQDRYYENKNNSINNLVVLDPLIKGRELFASECRDIYPTSYIKGKCKVFHYQDIFAAKDFNPYPDTFFCTLSYNPEARRLANTQGEIRVGASHQAKLPPCRTDILPQDMPEKCEQWEQVKWKCNIDDENLLTYLQAARSIAAFAGMCDRGNTDDMYDAAQRDDTTLNAFNILYENNYDTSLALQCLVKCPIPKNVDRKWNEDEHKKFIKGLRQYGKNFYRIKKELLPHRETNDLVEFYYLWKKTPGAQNSRPRRRIRPPSSTKKQSKKSNNSNLNYNNNSNKNDALSGSDSDSDNESDESDNKTSQLCCKHCTTALSKDWQNGGKDNVMLCMDCRMYYKKYGELPTLNTYDSNDNDKTATHENTFTPISNQTPKTTPTKTNANTPSSQTAKDTAIDLSVANTATTTNNNNNSNINTNGDSDVNAKSNDEQEHGLNISKLSCDINDDVLNKSNESRNSLDRKSSSSTPLHPIAIHPNSFNPLSQLPPSLINTHIINHNTSNTSSFHEPSQLNKPNDMFGNFMSPYISPLLINSGLITQAQQKSPNQNGGSNNVNDVDNGDSELDTSDSFVYVDDEKPPKPINITETKPADLIKEESMAMFVRIWDRGSNTCSRTDLQFKFIPNCTYLKHKASMKLKSEKKSHTNSSNNIKSNGNGNGNGISNNINQKPATNLNINNDMQSQYPFFNMPQKLKPNEMFNFNFDPVHNVNNHNNFLNQMSNAIGAGMAANSNNSNTNTSHHPHHHNLVMNQHVPNPYQLPHPLSQQHLHQFAPQHKQPTHHNTLQTSVSQPQFDTLPALRHLRDIADRSNQINHGFPLLRLPFMDSQRMDPRYEIEQQMRVALQHPENAYKNMNENLLNNKNNPNNLNNNNSNPNLHMINNQLNMLAQHPNFQAHFNSLANDPLANTHLAQQILNGLQNSLEGK